MANVQTADHTDPGAATDDPALLVEVSDTAGADDELLVEELLVEEVSIDGMCGVY